MNLNLMILKLQVVKKCPLPSDCLTSATASVGFQQGWPESLQHCSQAEASQPNKQTKKIPFVCLKSRLENL